MAENILLWCVNTSRIEHLPDGRQIGDTPQLVTHVELGDGTLIEGYASHSPGWSRRNNEPRQVQLGWPEDKEQRLAEFFEEQMTRHPTENTVNCHTFVAAVMGWEVLWKSTERQLNTPFSMPTVGRASSDHFENGQPYALKKRGGLRHSALGTPDPTRNLSVWGRQEYLFIASNEITSAYYNNATWYRHGSPSTSALGRLSGRILGYKPTTE